MPPLNFKLLFGLLLSCDEVVLVESPEVCVVEPSVGLGLALPCSKAEFLVLVSLEFELSLSCWQETAAKLINTNTNI